MNRAKLYHFWCKLACLVGGRLSSWYKILGENVLSPREKMHMVYIPIDKKVETPTQQILPMDVVEALVDKAHSQAIIHKCMCRVGGRCKDYPHDLACLVLGSAVQELDPGIGRIVSKDEAKAHIKKALDANLYPLLSHYERDAMMYSLDLERLLIVCFCCPCHCVIRQSGKLSDGIENSFYENTLPFPSVKITYSEDKCTGCQKCVALCPANAITYQNGKAVFDESKCKTCGQCAHACDAFGVEYEIQDVEKAIEDLGFTGDIT